MGNDDNKENTENAENNNKNEEEDSNNSKTEVLVKNQFNFSNRASQTFNEPMRDREVMTEPAPKSVFSQNANPSSIRDEYLSNLLKLKQQQLAEEKAKKNRSSLSANKVTDDKDKKKKD